MFARFRRPEATNECDECGTSRLPPGAALCWDCAHNQPPEVTEYRAPAGRPRLSVVPSSPPPPSAPLSVGWRSVAEHVWEGHRFEIHHDPATEIHRVLVDGEPVGLSVDNLPEAEAKLAHLMTEAVTGAPDPRPGDDQPDGLDDDGLTVRERRPLRDDWQRSPEAALERGRELVDDLVYRMLYRVVHPIRTFRGWAVLWGTGLWWLVAAWWNWATHNTARDRRVADKALTQDGGSDSAGLDWSTYHDAKVDKRLKIQAGLVALAVVVWLVGAVWVWRDLDQWYWVWWERPSWRVRLTAGAVVIVGPALIGWRVRPREAGPAFDAVVSAHRVPDLRRNPGLILDGFEGLGGAPTTRAYKRQRERGVPACTFREDIRTNDAGTGLICKVRTPEPASIMLKGTDPDAIMAKAVGRPTNLVKLSHQPTDEADVVTVFISRRPLGEMEPGDWPLLTHGTGNYFDGIVVGIDEYGDPVTVQLNETHGVIGGLSGSGKTASGIMPILAGLALDPRVRLFTYWKGGADGTPFAQVSHRIEFGNEPENINRMVADLEALKRTALTRQRFQQDHPEIFPAGAIDEAACDRVAADPALAAELDDHLLYPIVVSVDEVRWPMADERFRELVLWFATQGRSACISLLLATQKPSADTIPTEIQGQADVRASFRVKTDAERDGTLGKGNGVPVAVVRRLGRGMSVLDLKERPDPLLVKHYYMPLPALVKVLERAATARRARGLLSGQADGETPPDPTVDTIVDHLAPILAQLPGDRFHGQDLAVYLAEDHAQYDGVDPGRVLGMLRDHGVEVRQVETEVRTGPKAGERRNRNGIHRADFDAALAEVRADRDRVQSGAQTAFPGGADRGADDLDEWGADDDDDLETGEWA